MTFNLHLVKIGVLLETMVMKNMLRRTVSVMLVLSIFSAVIYGANPQVTLQVTGGVTGSIVIELYPDEAPVTVTNFIEYVQSGFYDGLLFHRAIDDFMIQGGGFDPDLVQKETAPAIINESSNGLSNLRGTIAMARTYQPHSATSQFFINQVDNTFLDYVPLYINSSGYSFTVFGYCVFGQVISGMDIVDAIAAVATQTENSMEDVPVNDIIIQRAVITLNVPVCPEKLAGDVNGDCSVNLSDFAAMAENWLMCNSITAICN